MITCQLHRATRKTIHALVEPNLDELEVNRLEVKINLDKTGEDGYKMRASTVGVQGHLRIGREPEQAKPSKPCDAVCCIQKPLSHLLHLLIKI